MVFKQKNNFRSRRKEVRQYRAHLLWSSLSACMVLLLGVGIWYGSRLPEVTIASVVISGGETVPHEVVQKKVEMALSGSYALLIPRRFSYLVPYQDIITAINSIPRVHDASVIRSFRNELSISFQEYVPYALWCDRVLTGSSTPAYCLFVDENGFAYSEAPPLLGETFVRFVVEGKKPEVGVHVYDTEALLRYRLFSDAISKNHKHRLRAITETKDSDLILHLSGEVNILMTKSADIEGIFQNIESVFLAKEFKGKKLESFEYIDLRFGNKVYIKERGAGEEEVIPPAIPVVKPVAQEPEAETPVSVPASTTSSASST